MTKQCIVTGKKVITGNNVSHSNQKTRRTFHPNIQKRRIMNPATGKLETVHISARGLRTLQKWDREGKTYDLRELAKQVQE